MCIVIPAWSECKEVSSIYLCICSIYTTVYYVLYVMFLMRFFSHIADGKEKRKKKERSLFFRIRSAEWRREKWSSLRFKTSGLQYIYMYTHVEVYVYDKKIEWPKRDTIQNCQLQFKSVYCSTKAYLNISVRIYNKLMEVKAFY